MNWSAACFALAMYSALAVAQNSSTSFQLVSNDTLPVTNLTSSCAEALMSNISCNSRVSLFRSDQYYDPRMLQQVCTTECETSIQQYESSLSSACGDNVRYNYTDFTYLPVSALGSRLLYYYQLSCLSDNNRFCNYVAYEASLQADANASTILGSPNSTEQISACDECFVKQLQLEAGSPFDGGSDLASEYASFTSSCSITGFPITTTTLASSTISTSVTPTPTCTGTVYDVQAGDTCESIAESHNTSIGWLVYDNNLSAYCASFNATSTPSLCIQNNCTTHKVVASDNCTSLAAANNVTVVQLISWNPMLDRTCANLGLSVDTNICVGKPGVPLPVVSATSGPASTFTTAAAAPTDAATNTTTDCGLYYQVQLGDYCNLVCLKFSISLDDFLFLNPEVNANCTNLFAKESYCVAPVGDLINYPGYPGYVAPANATTLTSAWADAPKATYVPPVLNITDPTPLANGTRTDCWSFVDGNSLQYNISETIYESPCDLIASVFGVTVDELQNWNPSLGTGEDCVFDTNAQYCLQAYNGTGSGDDTSSDTTGTADPIRNGTWTNCTAYVDVNFGMTCQDVFDNYDLTLAEFSTWNPEVGSKCENLWENYSYCVSLTLTLDDIGGNQDANSTSSSISSMTPTPTSSGVSIPGPTQSGIVSNCISYYVAQKTDTCNSIESVYGITDIQFHDWNPAVDDACVSGLWVGEAYCVGISGSTTTSTTATSTSSAAATTSSLAVPSPTQANSIISVCNKYAAAVKGDYCSIFATEHNITATQLYTWNTILGSEGADCDTEFWQGYYYCIGISS